MQRADGLFWRPGWTSSAPDSQWPKCSGIRKALQVLCKLPVTQEAGPAVMRALKDSRRFMRS